jgi:transcriptional regulator with XRE-family HTH domain
LSVVKTEERLAARRLRAEGWSIQEIERQLQVARSSVSRWVRDVELGGEARERLVAHTRMGPIVAAGRKAAQARITRDSYQERGRKLVRERDPSYSAGCSLYWAEGEKCRNSVRLVNSDPEVLVYFIGFLRRHFEIADDRVGVRCNLFADHQERQREIEDYWLDRLGLPRASLRKTTVNGYSKYSQKKRANKLPYGTCELVVHSTEVVQTIYGSIQELAGFDRPEWLD